MKPGAWEEAVSGQGQVGWVCRASRGDARQIRIHCLEGTSAFRTTSPSLRQFCSGSVKAMVHLQGIPQQASRSWPGATREGRKFTAFSPHVSARTHSLFLYHSL